MKHQQKRQERLSRDADWKLELDPDESSYPWLSQVRSPWRKRWLDSSVGGRRLRDNEGWVDDRNKERRRSHRPYARDWRYRKKLYDEVE